MWCGKLVAMATGMFSVRNDFITSVPVVGLNSFWWLISMDIKP